MRINIDLETYSSVDIKSCGMYKYMESPDFEVLLIAYSVDGGAVNVIDLASGEKVPETLENALYAPGTTIHGWNVIFERTGLSRLFGREIPLSSCRDTMLSALYCGYPASLDAAGTALGLEQDKRKMSVGKTLIKLFCTPTKPTNANGQRTRTYPRHEPEKWELFKEYNRQDVVTEMTIADTLAAFPVPVSVQAQWVMDARINERGVAVCHELVEGAKKISAEESERLMTEAKQITGLENPNSIVQLSSWLRSHGVTEFDALDKEAVSNLLANGVADKDAERMLRIRQLLGKSSIKKYDAITNCVCADGRVRGLFQFYGANRTGRFCIAQGSPVTVKTKAGVITEKPIEDVSLSDKVWDGSEWVSHEGVVYQGDKDVITWDGVTATPGHVVYVSASESMTLNEAREKGIKLWRGKNIGG